MIIVVEVYANWKTKPRGRGSLSAITQNSLGVFSETASEGQSGEENEETTSLVSTNALGTRRRGSMASVLEMMSATLAVQPSTAPTRGPVPLREFRLAFDLKF